MELLRRLLKFDEQFVSLTTLSFALSLLQGVLFIATTKSTHGWEACGWFLVYLSGRIMTKLPRNLALIGTLAWCLGIGLVLFSWYLRIID